MPYSSVLFHEIQEAALSRGVLVFASSTYEDEKRERELIGAFACRGVDGLIIVATVQSSGAFVREHRAGTAIVFVDQVSPVLELDCVLTNDLEGVRLGIDHQIGHGHLRIGYLGGLASPKATRRYQGYVQAMRARGLRVDNQLAHLDLPDDAAVEAAVAKVLTLAPAPTALFTSGAAITLATHRALCRRHLHRRVGLLGFDDSLASDLSAVGVSVVAPDPVCLARTASRLLFRRIDGDQALATHRLIAPRLIARGTGEIRAGEAHSGLRPGVALR
jgi:LacI family transcriptional regulator